jgi:hypothetical protein
VPTCLVVLAVTFVIYYGVTLALSAAFGLDPVGLSFVTYAAVMAPLFVLGAWLPAHAAGQGRRELGLNHLPPGRLLGWGAAGGLVGLFGNYALFALLYLVVRLLTGSGLESPDAETLRGLGSFYQAAAVLATAVLAPVCEEVFFRGALYSAMRKSLGRNRALILNALVFSLLHLKWQGLLSLFALGLIFAWLYEETDSVYPGMLAHAINNIVVLAVIYLT